MPAFFGTIGGAIGTDPDALVMGIESQSQPAKLRHNNLLLKTGIRFCELVDEIAEKMGINKEKLKEILNMIQEPISMEAQIGEEGGARLADILEEQDQQAPGDAAEFELMRQQLENALTLTLKEQTLQLKKKTDNCSFFTKGYTDSKSAYLN